MNATTDGVRVRMYRQGLGDCFLVSFPRTEGGRFHVMIDFGVLLGTADAESRMKAVARSIALETGGSDDGRTKGRIDVLVATHEHWDHLSGFIQAREEITELVEVGEVWLAWTEDPTDPLAAELRRDRARRIAHLRAAATRLRAAPGMEDSAEGVDALLGFFGVSGSGTTADAMKAVSGRSDARVVFRRPGEPAVPLPGVDGVRVYVLGPPQDRKLIRKSDPTKRGREVYDFHSELSLTETFFAAVTQDPNPEGEPILAAAALDPEVSELAFPFEREYRLDEAGARAYRVPGPDGDERFFFRELYGFGEDSGEAPRWRRIDADWLRLATDLALALDGDTNNTSLALAIEVGEDGPVLLFPADAQVGNWLSWASLSWPAGPGRPDGETVTADDLLRRTVLYKVGHHGSHNATLRDEGLEKMTSPDLVALIPVDEAMARKRRWKMPFGSLYERLKTRTRGRILRADHGRLSEEEAVAYGLTPAEYGEWRGRTREASDGLWIEYHLDA